MRSGLVFWFSGLSGAGKSKLSTLAAARLRAEGINVQVLDGDELRAKISLDLDFSRADIMENNRRIARHCEDMRRSVEVLLVPLISPFQEGRLLARQILSPGFFEVYVACDLQTVVARDPKGLYARAARGEITNMIGYTPDSPYQAPDNSDLVISTTQHYPDQSAAILYDFVMSKFTSV